MSTQPDVVELEVPDDPRYLEVAVATMEALAVRAGLDREQVEDLHSEVQTALAGRFTGTPRRDPIALRYEVGDGFLGVRVVERTSKRRGATS